MDEKLLWILGSGLVMSSFAWIGALALAFPERILQKLLLPLVSIAAGTMLGGAFFHLIPEAFEALGNGIEVPLYIMLGFVSFMAMEEFLHWHHCHRTPSHHHRPLTYLLLFGDAIHNFIGGLAVGGAFVVDINVGIAAWIAAAAHEIPQELGDFGVLVHGGWGKKKALVYNFLSALTFLFGGILAYLLADLIDVAVLIPFAAGNFIYIGAVDLVPEINRHESLARSFLHFSFMVFGASLILAVYFLLHTH